MGNNALPMDIRYIRGEHRIGGRELGEIVGYSNSAVRGHIQKIMGNFTEEVFNDLFIISRYYAPTNKMYCDEYWISRAGLKELKKRWSFYERARGVYGLLTEMDYQDQNKLTPEEPQFKPIEQDLKNENGQIVVSSRDVAERFGKRHEQVLRAIQDKMEINTKLCSSTYFIENTYVDSMNRPKKEFLLTRDGFTFIAMGFTGKEADDFKLAYIEAFNKMEEALKKQAPVLPTNFKEALVMLVAEVEAKEALQLEVKAKDEVIEVMKPKSEYCDMVLRANGTVTVSVISKDYGMSAVKMNALLHNLGVQYKQGNIWLLYAEHDDKGYTKSETYVDGEGYSTFTSVTTKWTQIGRLFIYELLKGKGLLPIVERGEKQWLC